MTAEFTGRPGLTNAVGGGVPGVPGGLPGRNDFSGLVLEVAVATPADTIAPGSRAGAVFALAPGVSPAIFACNAVAWVGSVRPFQPLSNFGDAIVVATGGNAADFFARVTVGAATERTPADRCENFPSGVTAFVPVLRETLTVGIAAPPERTSALFKA